jgi:ribosomal protein L11 methyltransferase
VDLRPSGDDAFDLLVAIGALDIEFVEDGIAAILPDEVSPGDLCEAVGKVNVEVSAATPRDDGSTWLVAPRDIQIGALQVTSSQTTNSAQAIRMVDSSAFGTGHHPSTALCIESLTEILGAERIDSMLDVGTGSGILALAALTMGVAEVVGLDIDSEALAIATENARLNNFSDRLHLFLGDPASVDGIWPLVVANVLAAPLMQMAPAIVRRLNRQGWLVLSGIAKSLVTEVISAYQHLGIHFLDAKERSGWVCLLARTSW